MSSSRIGSSYLKCSMPLIASVCLTCLLHSADKAKIAIFSYADYIDASYGASAGGTLSSKNAIDKSFQSLRAQGYTHIYWRVTGEGHPFRNLYYMNSAALTELMQAAAEYANTPYAWGPYELRWPIEVAHKHGLKFYAWVVPHNEGVPPGTYAQYGLAEHKFSNYLVEQPERRWPYWAALKMPGGGLMYQTEFTWQSKFVHDNPQFQLVDRAGKRYHFGVLEWAYPEARQYWLADVIHILDKYAVDGIYMDTRTELMSPEHADQFGFNDPVVKEFQRRHGVNIREEDFDVEAWRGLRGEYFTQFLKELSAAVHARGRLFSLGTSRGDYIGFPLGNMKLEWRKWISDKMIDEIHLDDHGWGWGRQGYGYMTDFATGRGLKSLEAAVKEDYGPLARRHGVKFYFFCAPYRPRPISDECCRGRATLNAVPAPSNWCERMEAMTEFDGTIVNKPVIRH